MKREAAILRDKAMASVRRAVGAFNAMDDDARHTTVLLHVQHSAEMLIKAALVEKGAKVMDKDTGRSIGFEKCLKRAESTLQLDDNQLGQLRTIDALRDDEQHWLGALDEELLYAEVRGTIEVLDQILHLVFVEGLADHLPDRALPITTKPLDDYDVLIDRQFSQVADLLSGGKRRRPEARAKIRGLLAMEGHAAEDARVSERDVNRVERAIKSGKTLDEVFPRLRTITATVSGDGPAVTVKFSKREGLPVTFAPADDPSATAVREVDLQKKYHWAAKNLADKVGLTAPKAGALRWHLGINNDPACSHVFEFSSQKIPRYSDNALAKMRDALKDGLDMTAVWADYQARPKGQPARPVD